jgi:Ca2+-binding EF-hand superfamily protein
MDELRQLLSFDESLDDRALSKLIEQVDLDGDGKVRLPIVGIFMPT